MKEDTVAGSFVFVDAMAFSAGHVDIIHVKCDINDT